MAIVAVHSKSCATFANFSEFKIVQHFREQLLDFSRHSRQYSIFCTIFAKFSWIWSKPSRGTCNFSYNWNGWSELKSKVVSYFPHKLESNTTPNSLNIYLIFLFIELYWKLWILKSFQVIIQFSFIWKTNASHFWAFLQNEKWVMHLLSIKHKIKWIEASC